MVSTTDRGNKVRWLEIWRSHKWLPNDRPGRRPRPDRYKGRRRGKA